MGRTALLAGIALLAGCAPKTATIPPLPRPPGDCVAAPAQTRIGAKWSEALGAELLTLTGSRTLRALGPGMAATMDFRPDRLTVAYDENQVIVRIGCG
ncbi:peptidase inhibitor I78 [Sphingobium sufflavum]|uniref:I78 family peptidase inhibitor n=1 Tax=Sphingobium sufflavum TaxID=1129547 RepID=UPI001EEDFEDB|nr:I78 family peptidase inhibitor [Sphingobium sufflavum]MCE7795709.1 peptidase inhibitor I78 [Sphingobium sufflavum]